MPPNLGPIREREGEGEGERERNREGERNVEREREMKLLLYRPDLDLGCGYRISYYSICREVVEQTMVVWESGV